MSMTYEEENAVIELERDIYFDETNHFKNDRKLIMDALKSGHYYLMQYANDEIKNDMQIALLCAGDPFSGDITFVDQSILRDPNFIIEAYKQANPICPLATPIKKPITLSSEKPAEKKSFLDHLNSEIYTTMDLDRMLQHLLIDKYSFIRFECGKNLVDSMWSLWESSALQRLRIDLSYDHEIKIPKIRYLANDFMPEDHYKIMLNGIIVYESFLAFDEDCKSKILQKIREVLMDNIESIKKLQNALYTMQWDILLNEKIWATNTITTKH